LNEGISNLDDVERFDINNNSLSLRDAYMDVGGRAKHGALAERVGEREKQTTLDMFNLPQPGSLP
jgi:hypothetical protein